MAFRVYYKNDLKGHSGMATGGRYEWFDDKEYATKMSAQRALSKYKARHSRHPNILSKGERFEVRFVGRRRESVPSIMDMFRR